MKPVLSYQKRFSPDGCVFKQSIRIDRDTLDVLRNAINSEIALKYPRKKEYVQTSGYEIFLKPIKVENGIVYLTHTQTRFINLFLKLNLKEYYNTCLLIR